MTVVVFGKADCPDFARASAVLVRFGIDFEFKDVTDDPDNARTAREVSNSDHTPVIVFPSQQVLVEPSDAELIAHVRSMAK